MMRVFDPGWKERLSPHLPFVIVGLAGLVGFVRVGLRHWREGAFELGCALLLAAVLRAVLPQNRVGLLSNRSRVVDVLLYGALGALIIAVALTITPGGLLGH